MKNTENNAKSLNAQNLVSLTAFLIVNALIITTIFIGTKLNAIFHLTECLSLKELQAILSIAGLSTVPALITGILTSFVPTSWKEVLVFWRIKETLPGHRAFSHIAPKDKRFTLSTLKRRVGKFPKSGKSQNALWYRLLKQNESDAGIQYAHRNFLLFRDMSSMTVLLILSAFLVYQWLGGFWSTLGICEAVLLLEYLIISNAARNAGTGLVSDVLAVVAAK